MYNIGRWWGSRRTIKTICPSSSAQQIANKLGLDDISVRDTGTGATSATSTQVVAFGKRISDRLSLIYEQGLSVANNALHIEYALSRTLRAEAGAVASFGLY